MTIQAKLNTFRYNKTNTINAFFMVFSLSNPYESNSNPDTNNIPWNAWSQMDFC